MKLQFSLFSTFILIFFSSCNQFNNNYKKVDGYPFKVMTYNIRYDTENDSLNAWSYRKEKVCNTIQFHDADLFGMQEALINQVEFVEECFPNFGRIGVGRDDGKDGGEFSPIFYNKDLFTLEEDSTFWLSETPEVPSKSWDAALPRIATWGKFVYKPTKEEFYYFNTHYDHRGTIAREESSKLLLLKITEIAGSSPVILTGDFNSTPESFPYRIIAESAEDETGAIVPLVDAFDVTELPHHGPTISFSGFAVTDSLAGPDRIDYIFVRNSIKVLKHGILTDFSDGSFPSDHLPVMAEIVLPD